MHLPGQWNKSALLALGIAYIACTGPAMMTAAAPAVAAASNRKQALAVAGFDRHRIFKQADRALGVAPISITQVPARLSEGGPHDFYSNGDYWWPDPTDAEVQWNMAVTQPLLWILLPADVPLTGN